VQLCQCKGLGQIVISAEIKPFDPVFHSTACSSNNKGDIDIILFRLTDQVQSVVIRQPNIQKNKIIEINSYLFGSIGTGICNVAQEVFLLQIEGNLVGEAFLVFNYKEVHVSKLKNPKEGAHHKKKTLHAGCAGIRIEWKNIARLKLNGEEVIAEVYGNTKIDLHWSECLSIGRRRSLAVVFPGPVFGRDRC